MKIVQIFKIYWPDNGGGIATVMESIANAMKKLYPTSTTTATMTISPSTLNHVIQSTPIIL